MTDTSPSHPNGLPHVRAIHRQLEVESNARRQAETDIDLFFELSLDMLCISNADGYFKRLSPAFTRTLGWSVEEMLARPFLDFVHPDDHVRTLREVERQIANGELVQPREGGGSEFILLFGNNSVVNGPGSH